MSSTKKPRDSFVYVRSDHNINTIQRTADSFLMPDDGNAYWLFHQRQYDRARKPKVLWALFQFFGSLELRIDPMEELRRYDRTFAIDTNLP